MNVHDETIDAFVVADYCVRCCTMFRHNDLVDMIVDGHLARFICKNCETEEDTIMLRGMFLYEKTPIRTKVRA